MKTLIDVLDELDTEDDAQWTAEGDPKLEVIGELLGRKVTRKEVKDAAPHFSRTNPQLEAITTEGDDNAEGNEEGQGEGRQEVLNAHNAIKGGLDLHLEDEADAEAEAMKPESQRLDEAAQRVQLKIDQLIKERNRLHALASQAHARETKDRDRNQGTRDRMDYIRKQAEVRAARASEAQKIADLLGVKGAVGAPSVIDQALRQRKPELGKTRPDYTPKAAEVLGSGELRPSPTLGRNPGVNG